MDPDVEPLMDELDRTIAGTWPESEWPELYELLAEACNQRARASRDKAT